MINTSNLDVLYYLAPVIIIVLLILAFSTGYDAASTTSNAANLCDKQGYFQVDQKRYKCEEVK